MANLRLAHLLIQGDGSQILITPNFDEFVLKALGIFGYGKLRLCDHPETVERVGPEEQDVQIIHVHGTYRYYDLANLKPQIESRATGSQSTSFTMLGLLDRILVNRSPLVVGYSGWEGDVIMSALHRRLERRRIRVQDVLVLLSRRCDGYFAPMAQRPHRCCVCLAGRNVATER